MKKIILLSFYILYAISSIAQSKTSSIKGHVLDGQTEEHLPGVTVYIDKNDTFYLPANLIEQLN